MGTYLSAMYQTDFWTDLQKSNKKTDGHIRKTDRQIRKTDIEADQQGSAGKQAVNKKKKSNRLMGREKMKDIHRQTEE